METIESINWVDAPRWSCKLQLGKSRDSYEFSVMWNTTSGSFEVTIKTLDGEEIITGRKMVLEVDLLEHVFNESKPTKCALIPCLSKPGLTRITYDSMISGDIRLFHITQQIKDNA